MRRGCRLCEAQSPTPEKFADRRSCEQMSLQKYRQNLEDFRDLRIDEGRCEFITEIIITSNKFQILDNFNLFTHLTILDVSYNQLISCEILNECKNLRHLNLSDNLLTHINLDLEKLLYFNCANNKQLIYLELNCQNIWLIDVSANDNLEYYLLYNFTNFTSCFKYLKNNSIIALNYKKELFIVLRRIEFYIPD